MIAIEKIGCYWQFRRGRASHTAEGHPANHWACSRGTGNTGKVWTRAFIVVSGGRKDEAGLGSANLNNFSRLWSIGAVSSCLVPSPGVVRAGETGVPLFPGFQLPVIVRGLKIVNGTSKAKQLVPLQSCTILSGEMKSRAVPLHLAWDRIHPLVQHMPACSLVT